MIDTPAPPPGLVRLVDDDPDLRAALGQSLRIAGFTVEAFDRAEAALAGLDDSYPGVVLTDVRMPGMDGLDLFAHLHRMDADLPVILLTGHGDVPMAVQALKSGVYDFLTKPVGVDDLSATLRRATATRRLVLENRQLRRMQAVADPGAPHWIGDSPAISHLRETAPRLAEAGVNVLITGPGGAGKEALARLIHRSGPRRSRAFVPVACSTLTEDRFEVDYLGTEARPALRQARSVGRLERAHRGTLFLDEVEALPPALQARILALIESRELWPLGAETPRPFEVQVIAASRSDLRAAVDQGRFRDDLFYRLAGVTLALPALKDHAGDVPLLFQHFLLMAAARLKLPLPPLTPELKAHLQAHDWPGNVRELQQFAERHLLGLAPAPVDTATDSPPLAEQIARYEAHLLREALRLTRGNASAAMARLGLPRKTFYDKLARHGIRAESFRTL